MSFVPRIAIVSWGATMDLLGVTPIVRHIRHCNPCAHLTWIVRDKFVDLVSTNPDIDAVKILELPVFAQDRQSNEHLMNKMALAIAQSPTYDKCFILQYWPNFSNFYERPNEDFISLRARNAGIDPSLITNRRPILMITDGDKKAVDERFPNLDWNKVITCNHISYAAKPCWSWEEYELLTGILSLNGYSVMFAGAEHEQIPTHALKSKEDGGGGAERVELTNVLDARGLPFRQWTECIRRSALYLGLDSGATAFACSTSTPIIKFHSPDFPLAKTGIRAMGLRTDENVLELCPAPMADSVFRLIMKMRRK